MRVSEILVEVFNEDDTGTIVFNVVGSESRKRNSDVVAVGLRIKLKLEIVVPKALISVVVTSVGKSTVTTLESEASRLTLGNDGKSI